MTFIDWFVKFIFLSWLMVFGIAFTDAALDLQDKTIKAYQKGSIPAVTFTKMLTAENPRRSKNKAKLTLDFTSGLTPEKVIYEK